MKINWKVRFSNPLWVSGFISQLFIVVQIIIVGANQAGFTDFVLLKEVEEWVLALVNAIFVVLASLGLVQDPTTKGPSDSEPALHYNKPK